MTHFAFKGGDVFIEHTNCSHDPDAKARIGPHACVTTISSWIQIIPDAAGAAPVWRPIRAGVAARIVALHRAGDATLEQAEALTL